MKHLLIVLFVSLPSIFWGQKLDYNTEKGYVAEGYDVVSYFTKSEPVKGNKKYQVAYDNAKFMFSSRENLALFSSNPEKYIPQYGGYCAYAVAAKKTKMDTDPESYEIRDGKLYLFYSSFFGNKLKDWQKADTKKLQEKGDKNWEKLKFKNK